MKNIEVKVEIIEWIDNHQPGFVRCRLIDAWGKAWHFQDKLPIFTDKDLNENSKFPQPGIINCVMIKREIDDKGREIISIDTEKPYEIEAEENCYCFDVLYNQIID